eukprot:180480-Rhodomonas_salina.1
MDPVTGLPAGMLEAGWFPASFVISQGGASASGFCSNCMNESGATRKPGSISLCTFAFAVSVAEIEQLGSKVLASHTRHAMSEPDLCCATSRLSEMMLSMRTLLVAPTSNLRACCAMFCR